MTAVASRSLLDEIVRDGAPQMLAAALKAEFTAYIDAHCHLIDKDGHRLVVRNGFHEERTVLTAAGGVLVRAPRVNDKRTDPDAGERKRFSSAGPGGTNGQTGDNGTASGAIVVPVGDGPTGVAVSPDGATAYTANSNTNTVSVIDTTTKTVTDTITVGMTPSWVAVSPDGNTAYVTNQNSGTMSVINTTSNTVTDTITVRTNPGAVAVSPRRRHHLRHQLRRRHRVRDRGVMANGGGKLDRPGYSSSRPRPTHLPPPDKVVTLPTPEPRRPAKKGSSSRH